MIFFTKSHIDSLKIPDFNRKSQVNTKLNLMVTNCDGESLFLSLIWQNEQRSTVRQNKLNHMILKSTITTLSRYATILQNALESVI